MSKKKKKMVELDLTDEEAMSAFGDVRFIEERQPQIAWKWGKWTFGFWTDPLNYTTFGIDLGPLEICWRQPGYRP